MSRDPEAIQRGYEREEQSIEERWLAGFLTDEERNDELRELGRAYREEAEAAAEDAYWDERERW